jgi:hypothetical protein
MYICWTVQLSTADVGRQIAAPILFALSLPQKQPSSEDVFATFF